MQIFILYLKVKDSSAIRTNKIRGPILNLF